jgi:hypothetical protein
LYSLGQTFFSVTAGPDHQRTIRGGSGRASRAFDTNADGRDELLVNGDLIDATTGAVVWAGHQLILCAMLPGWSAASNVALAACSVRLRYR